ncbi:MAG: class I SAM-dependent methyltransferase [Armatimonadetes bacterium]|nr:class I SAM-dependent methyltransferase [Armatimonadota bacterium]
MSGHDSLYFEKLGETYDSWVSPYDVARRTRLILEELIPRSAVADWQVLEVGCGTGLISSRLVERFPHLTVSDVSEKMTRQVGAALGCQQLPGDCAALPVAPGSFDMVVSSECIEHTPDPYASLEGMARVLRPGGWLVITTPNRLYFPVLRLAEKLRIRKFAGPEHWTWPHRTRRWLLERGFAETCFSGCHLFPWHVPGARAVLPFFDRFGAFLYPLMVNYGFRARKAASA